MTTTKRVPVSSHIVECGAGVPLLAIHGWTVDHRLMSGCLEPVFARRPGYRRVYPDLPGMGLTPAPPEVTSSDDLLDVLWDVVDERIGAEPFIVVGESYGGYLARAIANARPRQVAGLALVCSVGTVVFDGERRLPDRTVLRPDPDLLAGVEDQRLVEMFTGMAVAHTTRGLRRFRDEILPGIDLADGVALERVFARWRLSRDPEESTASYPGPTLIIAGRQDHVVGYDDLYAVLPHYPRATFAVLDVAGHNAQIEQPALFEALVSEWLDRVAVETEGGSPAAGLEPSIQTSH